MKKIMFIFATFFLVAFLGSCSDDNATNPVEKPSDFKSFLSVGNWWKYAVYNVNADGDTIGEPLETYTIKVVGTSKYGDIEAYQMVADAEYDDIVNMYIGGDGIYQFNYEYEYSDKRAWSKIFDFDSDNWEIYKEIIDEEEYGTTRKGKREMKGERIGTSTVLYKNKSYEAINYRQIYYYEVTSSYLDENGELVSSKRTDLDTTTFTFIPEIWLYNIIQSQDDEIDGEDVTTAYRKTILIDHYVK